MIDDIVQQIVHQEQEYQSVIELISPVLNGHKPIVYIPSRSNQQRKLVHIIAKQNGLISEVVEPVPHHQRRHQYYQPFNSSMLVCVSHISKNKYYKIDIDEFCGDELAYRLACLIISRLQNQ